ncbi:MAG: hypothetical protein B7Y25_07900 [Alphaproteobacteria bacterium 16-39-46]|nr:MAG: hypothetical protein B7Y25_07900 [Alphaproteobacteria bacterium 16-39-46]OZA41387.1 MAG: hypothetical protein B7X84_08090 [Alphaproteobacteria bacterium 17-39-52]HQS84416.1 hypothetical protein [Alphaproteobacteria bacterium]HQS94230.1 hypothetical protein [Alphaproteobacteria bacterium]
MYKKSLRISEFLNFKFKDLIQTKSVDNSFKTMQAAGRASEITAGKAGGFVENIMHAGRRQVP